MKIFDGLVNEVQRAPLNSLGALAGLGGLFVSLSDVLPGSSPVSPAGPILQTSVIIALLRWYILSVGCLYGLIWIGSLVLRSKPFVGMIFTTILALFGAFVCSYLSYTILGGGLVATSDNMGDQVYKVAGFAIADLSWIVVFSWAGFWTILNTGPFYQFISDADDPEVFVFYIFVAGGGLLFSCIVLGVAHFSIVDGLLPISS